MTSELEIADELVLGPKMASKSPVLGLRMTKSIDVPSEQDLENSERIRDSALEGSRIGKIKEWAVIRMRQLEEQNQRLLKQNLVCTQQLKMLASYAENTAMWKSALMTNVENINNANKLSASCCENFAGGGGGCKRGSDDSGTTSDINSSYLDDDCVVEWPLISDQKSTASLEKITALTATIDSLDKPSFVPLNISSSSLPISADANKPPITITNKLYHVTGDAKSLKSQKSINSQSKSINIHGSIDSQKRLSRSLIDALPLNHHSSVATVSLSNSQQKQPSAGVPKASAYAIVCYKKPQQGATIATKELGQHPSSSRQVTMPEKVPRDSSYGFNRPRTASDSAFKKPVPTPRRKPDFSGSEITGSQKKHVAQPPSVKLGNGLPLSARGDYVSKSKHSNYVNIDETLSVCQQQQPMSARDDWLTSARSVDQWSMTRGLSEMINQTSTKEGQQTTSDANLNGCYLNCVALSPDRCRTERTEGFDRDSLCNFVMQRSPANDEEDYVNVEVICSIKNYDADESEHEAFQSSEDADENQANKLALETSFYRVKKPAPHHQNGSSGSSSGSSGPVPPKHQLPSWESRLYDLAQRCLSTSTEPKVRQSIFSSCEPFNKSKDFNKADKDGNFLHSSLSSGVDKRAWSFGRRETVANAQGHIAVPVFSTVNGKVSKCKPSLHNRSLNDRVVGDLSMEPGSHISMQPYTSSSSNSNDRFSGSNSSSCKIQNISNRQNKFPSSASTGSDSGKQVWNANARHTTSDQSNCSKASCEGQSSLDHPGSSGSCDQPMPPFYCGHVEMMSDIHDAASSSDDDYAVPPDACEQPTEFFDDDEFKIRPNSMAKFEIRPLTSTENDFGDEAEYGIRCLAADGNTETLMSGADECHVEVEKSGFLNAMGSRTMSWKRRWYVLKNGELCSYKSQHDEGKRCIVRIPISNIIGITRIQPASGSPGFELATTKGRYKLTAEISEITDSWIKAFQRAMKGNMLNAAHDKAALGNFTVKGWLTKVKLGRSKKCWGLLADQTLMFFKNQNENVPIAQLSLKDSLVDEVSRGSDDSASDDPESTRDVYPEGSNTLGSSSNCSGNEFSISVQPSKQEPTYLVFHTRKLRDKWLYHIQLASRGGKLQGTAFEKHIQKLMESNGDPNAPEWMEATIAVAEPIINEPLTSAVGEKHRKEALALYKSCYLFCTTPVQSNAVDYHVMLAQNSLDQVMHNAALQNELYCQLVRLTAARHSDGLQAWHLLCLVLSLFLPKQYAVLWLLRKHLQRLASSKKEEGKYASFCQKVLERCLQNGPRLQRPSRMEATAMLSRKPYQHCMPYSIPINLANGSYKVIEYDGSSLVSECLRSICLAASLRPAGESGYALYSDDAQMEGVEHYLQSNAKLCDLISQWEQKLMENRTGKFPANRMIRLFCKKRFNWKQMQKSETANEKILYCYQANCLVANSCLPINLDMCTELASIMAQMHFGDYDPTQTSLVDNVFTRFFPPKLVPLTTELENRLRNLIAEKWLEILGTAPESCARSYLVALRQWPYFDSQFFEAKMRWRQEEKICLAVNETGVHLLSFGTMELVISYPYESVLTFGGCRDDFMLVTSREATSGDEPCKERLIFAMRKWEVLQITLLIADYIRLRRSRCRMKLISDPRSPRKAHSGGATGTPIRHPTNGSLPSPRRNVREAQ